jgi:predicted nucleic acid-binding protein
MSSTSAEDSLVFIDTNVLVYAHDASGGQRASRAREIVEQSWETGGACVSVQVLQEFFVTVTRKVPRPLTPRRASRIVENLTGWRVHAPQPEDVLAAIDIHVRSRIPLWDALIVRSALQLGCREILSEDLNPGPVHPGIRVRNPFTP